MPNFIVGNDVSEFQGQIDWDTYSKNSNLVIIRSTYGVGYYDKWFAHNRDEARRVGIARGFYHYSYPQYNKPEDEADWFLHALYDLQPGEVLALDFEEKYTGNVVAWCKVFLDHISQHLDGYKPLIYLNQSQVKSYDWSPLINEGYGLWIAGYTYDPSNNNVETGQWPFFAIQQWTDKQQVPGIPGNVDGDCFIGDIAAFKKYGYQPTPSTAPSPAPAQIAQSDDQNKNDQVTVTPSTQVQPSQPPQEDKPVSTSPTTIDKPMNTDETATDIKQNDAHLQILTSFITDILRFFHLIK